MKLRSGMANAQKSHRGAITPSIGVPVKRGEESLKARDLQGTSRSGSTLYPKLSSSRTKPHSPKGSCLYPKDPFGPTCSIMELAQNASRFRSRTCNENPHPTGPSFYINTRLTMAE